jgi:dienelactone hydrolase
MVASSSVAATAGPLTAPPPGPIRPIQPPPRVEPTSRVRYVEARMNVTNSAGFQTHLAVMLPPGKHAAGSLPCVFVAPAGTPLIWGNELEANYTDESLPYVRAGFAVVRYSLSGAMMGDPENASNQMLANCYGQFRAAHAGYADAAAAIDVALADYPEIDAARLYTAGHSSAGNVAMLTAQKDPRIKACVAYAPAINVRDRIGTEMFNELATVCPALDEFIKMSSPHEFGEPRCPTMLFHAEDDANVPLGPNRFYAVKHDKKVKFVTTPTGGHYDSMISAGIPAGIKYLVEEQKALPKKS